MWQSASLAIFSSFIYNYWKHHRDSLLVGEIVVADDIGGHFVFDCRLYSRSDVFIYKFVKLKKVGIYYNCIYL